MSPFAAIKIYPCGFLGDSKKPCVCSANQINSYRKRLSGPLLDRIDLDVFCASIPAEKLTSYQTGEKSKEIRTRIQKARDIQSKRYQNCKIKNNAELSAKDIKSYCQIDEQTTQLLRKAINTMNLTGRGFHRILKISRTVADLAGSDNIKLEHVAEALQYRPREET